MKIFELDEVNCEDRYATVSIRGDLLGTVAKCLRNCDEMRAKSNAARELGDALALAGDMIFRSVPVAANLYAADVVVEHDGTVHDHLADQDEQRINVA